MVSVYVVGFVGIQDQKPVREACQQSETGPPVVAATDFSGPKGTISVTHAVRVCENGNFERGL